MPLQKNEDAFLKELASAKESWTESALKGIADPSQLWFEDEQAWKVLAASLRSPEEKEAFGKVVSELLSGLVHSLLVTLDGGTHLAESTLLTVTDSDGYEFRRHLHNSWPLYSGALD